MEQSQPSGGATSTQEATRPADLAQPSPEEIRNTFREHWIRLTEAVNRKLLLSGWNDLVSAPVPSQETTDALTGLLYSEAEAGDVAAAYAEAILAAFHFRIAEEAIREAIHLGSGARHVIPRHGQRGRRGPVSEVTILRLAEDAIFHTLGSIAAGDLPKDQPPVINESNESNEEKVSVQQFENQRPTADEELAAIQERGLALAQAVQTIGSLGLEGVDTQVQIAAAHDIATHLEQWARQNGIKAIAEGKMSQVQLSRVLGVAQLTVGRWMKDYRQDEQQDQ